MKNLRISILLSLLIIVLSCPAFSQSKPNSIYLELLGNGGFYSVNYDRQFSDDFGARIGFMYVEDFLFFTDVKILLIPITLNYLIGSGNNKLELGGGPLIGFESGRDSFLGLSEGEKSSGSRIGATATIGYRYQKSDGGFLFRIGFTPLFTSEGILPWAGISLGFSF